MAWGRDLNNTLLLPCRKILYTNIELFENCEYIGSPIYINFIPDNYVLVTV